MRLLTFFDPERGRQAAVLVDRRVFALGCESLLECAGLEPSEFARLAARAQQGHAIPLNAVQLCAPIVPRKNVFCVGRNYLEHAKEGARTAGRDLKLPDVPTFFTKAPTAIAGPDATLHFSSAVSQQYDWEGELAAVIGKGGRDIAEGHALDHVFGYMCLNDITARDLQRAHLQWFKGKSLDQSCPIGPWIVTPDEIGDPHDLQLELRVNGVRKQHASTRSMIFPVARVVAELSKGMTLDAGDIIAMGTPAGVGFARTPPEFFKDGDVVEVEIERIGTLKNTISIKP